MKSTRAAILTLVALSCVTLAGIPASAAPIRTGIVLEFHCGDADVNVLLDPGSGNKSWSVDDATVTDGTMYHVKTFEIRIYPGTLTVEPQDQDPSFVWSHSYGQRTGQGDPVACLGSRPVGGNSTGFITVDATVRS